MSKRKEKGTNGYVAQINKMLRETYGEVPATLMILVKKTAQDMRILDRIIEELDGQSELTSVEVGSMGQHKQTVNPLIPYFDKASSRVTDDLYNLGLTARKQATPVAEGDMKKDDSDGVMGFFSPIPN